jgi:histone-lysine N-methyltransferase SETMAR
VRIIWATLYITARGESEHISIALRKFRWELLSHPPNSPDLAPSDFFLFPKQKECIKGKRWNSIDTLKAVVRNWFNSKDKSFYRKGLQSWKDRMEKYMNIEGKYVEKSVAT